ncbi:MAG: hypothetical protein CM1200mP41_31610 [Gammaproteobacteria bacterium]|nr:MAG: hypothetical protein CM1200mP41_31610 [Gammaproteobacteria bacterium]
MHSWPHATAVRRQFLDLVDTYGVDKIGPYLEEILDYAERMTRAAIKELPDGEFSFEDWIDDDGVEFGKPIRLFVNSDEKGRQFVGRLDWNIRTS